MRRCDEAQKKIPAVGHGCRTRVCPPPSSPEVAGQGQHSAGGEFPPSHMVERTPCSRWAVLGSEQTLKGFLTPLIEKKKDGSSFMGLQIYNSHTPSRLLLWTHSKTPWQLWKWSSVLSGRWLFVSTHRGCRWFFLAAFAPGELSQDPAHNSGFRYPTWNRPGESPRNGQKWGFALPARHREGRKGSSLSTSSFFSHEK